MPPYFASLARSLAMLGAAYCARAADRWRQAAIVYARNIALGVVLLLVAGWLGGVAILFIIGALFFQLAGWTFLVQPALVTAGVILFVAVLTFLAALRLHRTKMRAIRRDLGGSQR